MAEVVPQFVEGTIQTSAEIQKARLIDESLRRTIFYTANFGLYDLENEDAVATRISNIDFVMISPLTYEKNLNAFIKFMLKIE